MTTHPYCIKMGQERNIGRWGGKLKASKEGGGEGVTFERSIYSSWSKRLLWRSN